MQIFSADSEDDINFFGTDGLGQQKSKFPPKTELLKGKFKVRGQEMAIDRKNIVIRSVGKNLLGMC